MGRRLPPMLAGAGLVLTLAAATAQGGHWAEMLAQAWQDLTPRERFDALQNYQHYERLPQERQRAIDEQYERWRHMDPDQRERVQQNYQRLQQLPPQERERFERKSERWRQRTQPTE